MSKEATNESRRSFRKAAENLWARKWIRLLVFSMITYFSYQLYAEGIRSSNPILEGIASGLFTAMIVTLGDILINWNTSTEIENTLQTAKLQTEKSIQDMELNTSKRIHEMKAVIDNNCSQLAETARQLDEEAEKLSVMVATLGGDKCFFCKNNIERICMNRESCDLASFFLSAKESISILATNLDSFKGYIDILKKKAAENVTVRIAAMHPHLARDFFQRRILGTERPEDAWEKMKTTLEMFIAHSSHGGYELRVYNGISPTLVLIMVDQKCYVAYLLNNKKTRDTIHFLFGNANYSDAESPVRYFKDHFESTRKHTDTRSCSKAEIASIRYDDETPALEPTSAFSKPVSDGENNRKEPR